MASCAWFWISTNPSARAAFTTGPEQQYGDRLVIDLHRAGNLQTVKRASEGYVSGRDIVIAIDPGHGGHDPGAIGKAKTREKDVALAIGRLLAARINAEPGMKAVMIRDSDYYVDHRKRMAKLRASKKADLFVSIHADAVQRSTRQRRLGVCIVDQGRERRKPRRNWRPRKGFRSASAASRWMTRTKCWRPYCSTCRKMPRLAQAWMSAAR